MGFYSMASRVSIVLSMVLTLYFTRALAVSTLENIFSITGVITFQGEIPPNSTRALSVSLAVATQWLFK
jgi:hypothetical protein